MKSILSIKPVAKLIGVTMLAGLTLPVMAMPLSGSGNNLAGPAANPGSISSVAAHNANTTGNITAFSTVWGADVDTPWQGTITGSGPDPFVGAVGTTSYSFTALNVGYLAPGAYVFLHDVDQANESITVQAFDVLGNVINQAWLGEAASASFNGSATVPANRMPGWAFSGGQYVFDGSNVASASGSVNVWLPTLEDIYSLEITRSAVNGRARIMAPAAPVVAVPLLPSLAGVLGGLLLIRRR